MMSRLLRHIVLGAMLRVGAAVQADKDLDLILYGADGCIGHVAATYLAQQMGLKWAIAGRNKTHLQGVLQDLLKEGMNSSTPEIIVAALDEKTDPKPWVARAKAVVSAAGPFSLHGGEYLVKACVETGVHYSDVSDEYWWQREMVDRYDAAAQTSGARIVLATGFCTLVGDLGSQLALAGLGELETQGAELDAWLEGYDGGGSMGVIHTLIGSLNASFPKAWQTDPYVLAPKAAADVRVDTLVTGMGYPRLVSGEGLIVGNVFGLMDARMLRVSFAQLDQRVKLRVGATASVYAKWAAFLLEHPFSWTRLATCPTQTLLEDGSWQYRFKASRDGRSHTVLLSGSGDPGFFTTARGLAETGLCLAGKTAGCVRAGSRGGVHSSMSTMDPRVMLKRLEDVKLVKVQSVTDEAASELVVM